MKKILMMITVVCLVVSINKVQAGDNVEDYLKTVLDNYSATQASDYIKGYMQPLSTALGTSMGGSMYHRAYTKGFPRFDAGISAVYISLPDEAKTFMSPVDGMGEVPTLFGAKNAQNAAIQGFDESRFLLPVLHANLGLFANVEATARFASANVDYLGDITLIGGGLKYGLSDMIPIPMFPLDFSVQAAYHKFTLGDILDAGTFSMNFQASGSIPLIPIDIYGGIGYDNSSLKVVSDKILPGAGVGDITIDGDNAFRMNLGASFTLLFFNIHADYNIGEYNSLGGGAMIVF